MNTVEILPILEADGEKAYRAIAPTHNATGKTPGQALDALIALSEQPDFDRLIVTQSQDDNTPVAVDEPLFTSEQQDRLLLLMGLWQESRDKGQALPAEQKAELEALVEAELLAETARTEALLKREAIERQHSDISSSD